MGKFPALNPLIASAAICSTCGEYMLIEVERGPLNRVEKIVYRCENSVTGCHYQVESDQRLNGMCITITKTKE